MYKDLITFDPQTGGFLDSSVISGLSSDIGYAEENQYSHDRRFPMQKEEFAKQKFIDSEVAEEAAMFLPRVQTTRYAYEGTHWHLLHVTPISPIGLSASPSQVAYEPAKFVLEARATTLPGPVVNEDPWKEVVWELTRKAIGVEWTRRAYKARIQALRHLTEEEDYCLKPSSEKDFWSFFEMNPFVRQGNLVLLENGNLRAIWKDGRGTQIGLQFLGSGTIQFVIFKVRTEGKPVSRVYGRDDFEGIKCQIQAFELHPMMSS